MKRKASVRWVQWMSVLVLAIAGKVGVAQANELLCDCQKIVSQKPLKKAFVFGGEVQTQKQCCVHQTASSITCRFGVDLGTEQDGTVCKRQKMSGHSVASSKQGSSKVRAKAKVNAPEPDRGQPTVDQGRGRTDDDVPPAQEAQD